MALPEFQLLRPKTIQSAVALLAQHKGDIQVLAGGTDLLPSMRQKLFAPKYVLDIRGIDEIKRIRVLSSGLEIGALVTLSQIEDSEYIRRSYPVLRKAAMTVASPILAEHGHDRRQHLPRHSMPLVQPVAGVADVVRILY